MFVPLVFCYIVFNFVFGFQQMPELTGIALQFIQQFIVSFLGVFVLFHTLTNLLHSDLDLK